MSQVQCWPSDVKKAPCNTVRAGIDHVSRAANVHVSTRSRQRISCSYGVGIWYENNEVSVVFAQLMHLRLNVARIMM
jgi:hypothetical protein